MAKPLIPILLLAAGQSSRMGGTDKLAQIVDGMPLLRRAAIIATAAMCGPVIVALPPQPHPRHDLLEGLNVDPVVVPDPSEGMNVSLRAAMGRVPAAADAVMILLADLPDLTTNDLRDVAQNYDSNSENLIWRGTTPTGEAGHPVLFSARLFSDLLALTGDSGAQSIVRANKAHLVNVALPGRNACRDLDTPEDWEEWRAENNQITL